MRILEKNVIDVFLSISLPKSLKENFSPFLIFYLLIWPAVAEISSENLGDLKSRISIFDDWTMTGAGVKQPLDNLKLILSKNGRVVSDFDFKGRYPDRLDGSITSGNKTRQITLKKNLHLLSADYKEIYYEGTNRIVTAATSSDTKAFCRYDGQMVDDANSYVTVNLCNQSVSGTAHIDDEHYVIDNQRLISSPQYVPYDPNYSCGHESASLTPKIDAVYVRRKRALESKPTYYKKFIAWKELYVELAVVFDNSMFKKYGKDKKLLFERAKDLANYINAYYQPVRIKVALVGVEIWSESDRIVVNTSGDATLDQFLRYRRVNLIHDIPNDHAQLLTNVTFTGGVVGKAMKGTMCSMELSGAVVMDHDRFKSPAPIAATMAHEMGHNFGMEHDNDTCECPQQRCLMAASSSGAGNVYWSSCSMEYLSWSLSHGTDYCLRNKPPVSKEPVCGNGFVEEGEECDCGLPEVCDNECCNPNTCKFAAGAVCANGGCCDLSSCQFMSLATVCRETEDECDLPEFCNGKSETCPKNTYKQNGISCRGNKAFCHNGTCATHDSQCKLIWGPTGQTAANECYLLNLKGEAVGHCGLDRDGSFIRCEKQDSVCGLLQCTHKTERTNFGDRSVVHMTSSVMKIDGQLVNCHTTMIDLGFDKPNPGFVPSGAKCGDGKMCQKQKCVNVSSVLAELPCPANCHGSGVCNNFGHCHCIGGYGGIDCSIPGLGGSIESGPASTGAGKFNVGIGILIFVLVVLPLITAIVTILYRKGVIKAPRFKVIDLLFKPRRPKSRPASSILSDVSQTRGRTFDSNTVSRKAPPILAFSTDREQQQRSPQMTSREPVGTLLFTSHSNNSAPAVTTTATVQKAPVGIHYESNYESAPPRPARPKEEILEKLYYTDVSSLPRVDYAGMKKGEPVDGSFFSEVMKTLEPSDRGYVATENAASEQDYGAVILPQRRAPPPPIEEEESTENAGEIEKEETKAASVKDKKKFFESAGSGSKGSAESPGTLKRSPKDGSFKKGSKPATLEKKAPEISDPLNPIIGGEPVVQASTLLIVPHLDNQTLPRKKNSDAALSTSAVYRVRQMNQRKSSAVEEPEWRKNGRPVSNMVQRSQSSVSGSRPTIAPPPPPPPISAKPSFTLTPSAKPSSRVRQDDPKSAIPLVGNENFDSDSSSSSNGEQKSKRRSSSETTENYYDVIGSPVDEEKEGIYADIDEIRAAIKNAQNPPPAATCQSSKPSPPCYRSLYTDATGQKGNYGNSESKKPETK